MGVHVVFGVVSKRRFRSCDDEIPTCKTPVDLTLDNGWTSYHTRRMQERRAFIR